MAGLPHLEIMEEALLHPIPKKTTPFSLAGQVDLGSLATQWGLPLENLVRMADQDHMNLGVLHNMKAALLKGHLLALSSDTTPLMAIHGQYGKNLVSLTSQPLRNGEDPMSQLQRHPLRLGPMHHMVLHMVVVQVPMLRANSMMGNPLHLAQGGEMMAVMAPYLRLCSHGKIRGGAISLLQTLVLQSVKEGRLDSTLCPGDGLSWLWFPFHVWARTLGQGDKYMSQLNMSRAEPVLKTEDLDLQIKGISKFITMVDGLLYTRKFSFGIKSAN